MSARFDRAGFPRAGAFLLGMLVAVSLFRWVAVSSNQLVYPFDLAYEGPSSHTMVECIKRGYPLYAERVYAREPYLFSPYTPLYHYLVSLLPESRTNRFLVGRIVAMMFFLLCGILIAFTGARSGAPRAGWLAFGCFFLFRPVVFEGAYLKNDSMALFFSIAAVITAWRRHDRAGGVPAAALLCVLSFAAKQSYVAAAPACLVYFLFRSRRLGIRFAAWTGLFFSLFFGVAAWAWGRDFFLSVFRGPQNIPSLENALILILSVAREPAFLFWSFFGAAALCAVPRENDSRKETPFGIYLFFSFAVLVVTVGSQGGARNYFLEYWAALLLWIACFTGRSLQTGRMSGRGFLLSAAIPAMILASVELATAKPRTYTHLTPKKMERSSRIVGELRKIVRLIGKDDPGILCLAWPNHVRTVTRKTIVSDPFLYSRLWNCGIVDVNAVIRDVADQKFDLVILSRDSLLGERRPRCPVDYLVRAVEYRYRVVGSGYFLYLAPRREGNPADAAKERIPA